MPGGDCRLKLLLVVTVLCLYCMISTLISVTRHLPPSHPGPGTNVYFIAMFPVELQTKVGEYFTITETLNWDTGAKMKTAGRL